jgi:hypothetical protein
MIIGYPFGVNTVINHLCIRHVCGQNPQGGQLSRQIPKIQFNGIGGLLTYISLTPSADVFA